MLWVPLWASACDAQTILHGARGREILYSAGRVALEVALRQLRKHMLKSARALRRETTTRQIPVGKGRPLQELPDAVLS